MSIDTYAGMLADPATVAQLLAMGIPQEQIDAGLARYELAQQDADARAQIEAAAAAHRAEREAALAEFHGAYEAISGAVAAGDTATAAGYLVGYSAGGLTYDQATANIEGRPWPEEVTKAAATTEPGPAAQVREAGPVSAYDPGPVHGYGLPDYTDPAQATAAAANDARLVSDPAYVQMEIARTNAVIEARQAENLPTAAQEFYLARLIDLAGGGDWYASGQTEEAYRIAAEHGPAPARPAAAGPEGPAFVGGFLLDAWRSIPWWGWLISAGLILVYGRRK